MSLRRPSMIAVGLWILLASWRADAATGLLETQLLASDGVEGDLFGNAVEIDADTIVVGAPGHGLFTGAVYVFGVGATPGIYVETKRVESSDGESNDSFGQSVAIDADTLLIGAPGDQDPGFASGAAYVFERDLGGPSSWGEAKKIESLDLAQADSFGFAVALSRDTAVVGAHGDAEAGAFSGAAYVFERDLGGAGAWGQTKKLVPGDAISGHNFGWAVSIDGDTIVVGAYGDGDLGFSAGAAYVFERDEGGADQWGEVLKLKAPDGVNFDQFGRSVSVHGDHLVVGMFSDDDPFHKSGSAYVFERDLGGPGAWGLSAKIQHADAGVQDWFGYDVAIHGDRAVAGAMTNATPFVRTGAGYLFRRHHTGFDAWGQASKLAASDRVEGDQFGWQVAVGDEAIVVGAHRRSNETGAVYVYVDDPSSLPALSGVGLAALVGAIAALGLASRHLRIAPNS